MKVFSLCLLACFCFFAQASALTKGMSIRAVEKELGKPESKLSMGSKDILNYSDAGKLEFVNGALTSVNGVLLSASATAPKAIEQVKPAPAALAVNEASIPTAPAPSEAPVSTAPAEAPIKAEIPESSNDLTINGITQSIQGQETLSVDEIAEGGYNYTKIAQDLESTITHESEEDVAQEPTSPENERLASILIGFIIEVVVTLIVLKVAFQVVGFPALWRQLILLSLAVALASAMVSYALHFGSMNPVSMGVSFIVLLLLIRQMTDVREWATAIQIAITARIVSIVLMWVAFAGVMMLFGMSRG